MGGLENHLCTYINLKGPVSWKIKDSLNTSGPQTLRMGHEETTSHPRIGILFTSQFSRAKVRDWWSQ